MRSLIVSSDRFEDSELSEPLQQLQTKGVEVDIAAPQQGPIIGKHEQRVGAGLALSAVGAEYYDLLLLPGDEEVVVDGNLFTLGQAADIRAFMRAIFGITGLSR